MMGWTGASLWMMGLWGGFMIFVWALIIVGIITIIRGLGMSSGARRETQQKTPLQILQERALHLGDRSAQIADVKLLAHVAQQQHSAPAHD